MPKKESPLAALSDFLPAGSFAMVEPYLMHYKVHLTITRTRTTVLGDYRNAHADKAHRITVNGNLNAYAFLITLLHELAHLIVYIRFGHRVQSHGKEWKQQFAEILKPFLVSGVFPTDVKNHLTKSSAALPASSCADDMLMRILRRYDPVKNGYVLIEELESGDCFEISNGRLFKRLEKIRKRYKAIDLQNQRVYLFSPVYEVKRSLATGI
jgi:hypothetical protein